MRISVLLAVLALTFAGFSAYAEDTKKPAADEEVLNLDEAKALIESSPAAKDAIKGTVPEDVSQNYYDIHARQIAYRENVKEYRASLEARRESFARPQYNALERYRETIAKVYAAEGEAAAKARADVKDVKKKKEIDYSKEKPAIKDEDVAVADIEEEGGLTEKPIPSDPEVEEGAPKKKVVTSEDAPDFDPSDL